MDDALPTRNEPAIAWAAMQRRSSKRMILRIDAVAAAAILFINAWMFALPVDPGTLPVWLTPIQPVRGVWLYEVLVIAYVGLMLILQGGDLPLPRGRALIVTGLIFTLGILATASAIANARPVKELISAQRFVVLALYFMAAVLWSSRHSPVFVLRSFLAGLLAAGSVNLLYTFKLHIQELGGLPMLLGQNGPGGCLGMGVIFSAWLMLIRRRPLDVVIATGTAIVGVVAASISYSKLSMLMAGAGALAWSFVVLREVTNRRSWRWLAAIAVALAIVLPFQREAAKRYIAGVQTFVDYKFVRLDPLSISTRTQYARITWEILLGHPMLGAGMGGFYEAAYATDAYRNDRSVKQDPEAGLAGASHPESSFLYSAAATGALGLFTSIVLFATGCLMLRRAMIRRGRSGYILWVCTLFGYFVFGSTLPTLFTTSMYYIPLAVAAADQ